MKGFKKFYLWGMQAKLYMGIIFAALVFFVGIVTAIFGGDAIGLWALLEMFAVSMVIGFCQTWLLPDYVDFSKGVFFRRSVVWLALSVLASVVTAWLGGWFASMAGWLVWLLGAFVLFGCVAVLVGVRFEQESDTCRLNESLQQFKENL